MRKFSIILLVLLISLVSLGAESLQNLFPDMSQEKLSSLLSGEVLQDSSAEGDIRYMVPRGALMTESAETVFSYEKGFAVAVNVLVPYPEAFSSMSKEEQLLYLYNSGMKMSTLEGITYISRRAGNKPKVLFEEAYMLGSPDSDDRIDDFVLDSIPDYEVRYAFLDDTSFGKNVYRVDCRTKEDGISLEMRNSDELKFMGIGIVAEGKVTMLLEITLTDEGILLSGIGAVKDKKAQMTILFYKVDLEESFMNRIIALKDWYLGNLV